MKKIITLSPAEILALTVSGLAARRRATPVRAPSSNELANQARMAERARHNEEVERKKAAKKAAKLKPLRETP